MAETALALFLDAGSRDGPPHTTLDDPAISATLLAALEALRAERREATVLLRGVDARAIQGSELAAAIKCQDVGFRAGTTGTTPLGASIGDSDWDTGARLCREREGADYRAVAFIAGRIPSTYVPDGWSPQCLSALEEAGMRVVASPRAFLTNEGNPYFYAGRLHLAESGPNLITDAGAFANAAATSNLIERVIGRLRALGNQGGLVSVHLSLGHGPPTGCARGLARFLHEVESRSGIRVESARQIADRFADISYEHRIALEDLLELARHASRPQIGPFLYRAGYIAPVEQLYLLASAWDETRRKGKLVRNSTTRTPLGPTEKGESDRDITQIPAEHVTGLVGEVLTHMTTRGRVPARVAVPGGHLAVEDLLPTLAAAFHESLNQVGLTVHRGRLAEPNRVREDLAQEVWRGPGYPSEFSAKNQLELARLQLWTYKPVFGLAESPSSANSP